MNALTKNITILIILNAFSCYLYIRYCDKWKDVGRKRKGNLLMKKLSFLLNFHTEEYSILHWLTGSLVSINLIVQGAMYIYLVFFQDIFSEKIEFVISIIFVFMIQNIIVIMLYILFRSCRSKYERAVKELQERRSLSIKKRYHYRSKLIWETKQICRKSKSQKGTIAILPWGFGIGTDGYGTDSSDSRFTQLLYGQIYEICIGDYTSLAYSIAKEGYRVILMRLKERKKGGMDTLCKDIEIFLERNVEKEEKLILFAHGLEGVLWGLQLANKHQTDGLILVGGNLQGLLAGRKYYWENTSIPMSWEWEEKVELYRCLLELQVEKLKNISVPLLRIIPDKAPYMPGGKGEDDLHCLDKRNIQTSIIKMQEYLVDNESLPDVAKYVGKDKKLGIEPKLLETILVWLDRNIVD